MSDDPFVPDFGDPYGLDDPRNVHAVHPYSNVTGKPVRGAHIPPTVILEHPKSNPAMDPKNLPDAWKPKAEAQPISPDEAVIPDRESDAPEVLAAWYSGFAFAEHYRKVCLSLARELVRAQFAAKKEKVTESRLDDLSRIHPLYLDYLARHLEGRTKWEHEFLAMRGAA